MPNPLTYLPADTLNHDKQVRPGHEAAIDTRADSMETRVVGSVVSRRSGEDAMSLRMVFYRRVKTGKRFYRPMNRVVRDRLRSIAAGHQHPDDVVVAGGGARPNARFRHLCDLAAIGPKVNV
ncbi:MAG: hypothetical protein AB8G99_05440, partial [Planctomycetaceae bacterium]